MIVFVKNFGSEFITDEILLYTFKSKEGMEISITNFGGIITSIKVPDKNKRIEEISIGYDTLQKYIDPHPYYGAIIGRYANRIKNGQVRIDGKDYKLSLNEGQCHLHGGLKGFDKKLWNPILENDGKCATLKLFYLSKDLEEGYPGNLLVNVSYKIFDNNTFDIYFQATTDKSTIVNLTSHCYFNLNGFKKNVLNHMISISADMYLQNTKDLTPSGEMVKVDSSPYDFRNPKSIKSGISNLEKGFDICYVLNSPSLSKPSAIVEDPDSGRYLKVYTTQPSIQFYTMITFDQNKKSFNSFCLEPQHFPDSPNNTNFPSTLLRPNEEYNQVIRFEFGVKP